MRLELDDVGVFESKQHDKNIEYSEKTTQTDPYLLNRSKLEQASKNNGAGAAASPCNHPSLTCQVRSPKVTITSKVNTS